MRAVPSAVDRLSACLAGLGWVRDLLVAGSLATGDYLSGVSDIDLVAVTAGPVDGPREVALVEVHRDLDRSAARGLDLGCVYVDERRLTDPEARHPTWTHGGLVHRPLSSIARAELACHGFAIFGRPPSDLLPAPSEEDVRAAACTELCGYWAWASRRPWLWLNPTIADLGLTSMARARYTLRTGRLLTKTAAVDELRAPDWLIEQVRERRRGGRQASPRLRTAWIAWRDARRTVGSACADASSAD